MKQPIPALGLARHPPSANIHLQRLMKKSRRPESRITLIPHLDELLPCDTVSHMLVPLLVLLHRLAWGGGTPLFGRVIVTRPDLDLGGQVEEFLARVVEVVCASAWEVATGCAEVCVEEGVTAEDIVWRVC